MAFSNEIGVFFSLWKHVAVTRSGCMNRIPKIVLIVTDYTVPHEAINIAPRLNIISVSIYPIIYTNLKQSTTINLHLRNPSIPLNLR